MSYHGVDKSAYQQGPPLYTEGHLTQETEGGKIAAQVAVGIAQDAVEAAILQGHKYGREETVASHPNLQSPTYLMRASAPFVEEAEISSSKVLDDLIENLPKDLKERVRYEMNLPLSLRNEDYSCLIAALTTLSLSMALIELTSKEIDQSSQTALQAKKSLSLSTRALFQAFQTSKEMTQELTNLLQVLGNGYPHIDNALEMSFIQKETAAQLEKWGRNIQEEGVKSQEKAKLDQLLRQLYSAKEGTFAKTGGSFHILKNLLDLEIAAFSMLGAPKSTRPFLLGLLLSSVGESKGQDFFGKNSSKVLDKVADSALQIIGSEKSSVEALFMKPFVAFAAKAWLVAFHANL